MVMRKGLGVKLICVGVVACVVVPLGQLLLPVDVFGTFPANAVEAVVTTSLGFGLYAMLFG